MKRLVVALFVLAAALGAPAQQQLPRPEYPEPQFQRDRWLNLNGSWEFEFDDENAGLEEEWATSGRKFSRRILVPFCFESRMSGIGDTSFHPWVWYRRQVTVPAEWSGQRVLLRFGAVDYRAMVWVNGQLAGTHEGGHTPFSIDVTRFLKPGQATIVVRAEDPPTDRSIPRGKQYWEPKSRSIFYTRTSGIWQTVWLEAVGDSYLDSVHITPSLDGMVRAEAVVARPQPEVELRASITFNGRAVATASAPVGAGGRGVVGMAVADVRRWSVGSPNLYDVTFEIVKGGEVLDRVASYFGFRTVVTENGRVLLNGNPVTLKFVLDQGYWPESVMTPPSDEAIQLDIRLTKEMGFNGARKHQKLEDPRFLYWADKMGFLVSDEMANAHVFSDEYVSRFTREWADAVERDRNHPSVIVWAPINESWGVPNLRDARQQAHLREIYWLTRALDPTRLVIDNEGWEHTETTDLFAIHDYVRAGNLLAERYRDLEKPDPVFPDNAPRYLLPGYRYNGTPVYLSEFGGIAYIPAGHQVPGDSWGYSGVEKTPEAALERLRGLYEAIARTPAFAGFCYTQLTDVEQEVNGLLTDDRKPKFDVKTVREINQVVR